MGGRCGWRDARVGGRGASGAGEWHLLREALRHGWAIPTCAGRAVGVIAAALEGVKTERGGAGGVQRNVQRLYIMLSATREPAQGVG